MSIPTVRGDFRVFLPSVTCGAKESSEVNLPQLRSHAVRVLSERVEQRDHRPAKEEPSRTRVCLDNNTLTFDIIDPKEAKAYLEPLVKRASLLSRTGFGILAGTFCCMTGAVVAEERTFVYINSLTQMSRYFHVAAAVVALAIAFFALSTSDSLTELANKFQKNTSLSLTEFSETRTRVLQQTSAYTPFGEKHRHGIDLGGACITRKEAEALFKERVKSWANRFNDLWPWAKDPDCSSQKEDCIQNATLFLRMNFTPLEVSRSYLGVPTDNTAFQQCNQSYERDGDRLAFLNKATEIFREKFPEAFNVSS